MKPNHREYNTNSFHCILYVTFPLNLYFKDTALTIFLFTFKLFDFSYLVYYISSVNYFESTHIGIIKKIVEKVQNVMCTLSCNIKCKQLTKSNKG